MSDETGTDSDYGLMDTRYAVYFAPPPDSPLKQLGRCLARARPRPRRARSRSPWSTRITPERLHGDHGLPAPLRLPCHAEGAVRARPGHRGRGLLGDVEAFAADQRPFRVRLKVGELDGFLALVPAEPAPELDELAADCVREFDRFRAPLTDARRARRRAPEQLSEREREHLERWGYPYVFELLPLPHDPDRPAGGAGARHGQGRSSSTPSRRSWPQPLRVDQLALFTQTHRGGAVPGRRPLPVPRLSRPPWRARSRPGSGAFIALIAALMTVTAMSIDINLPAIPATAAALGASLTTAQLTVSLFFAGFARRASCSGGRSPTGPAASPRC